MTSAPGDGGISIVVPVLDEEESVPLLVERLLEIARTNALDLREIVLVDDGSRDRSWTVMGDLTKAHPEVIAIRLRRNFGKSTALNVGIAEAKGAIIVTMDADLQDDPAELPRFIALLEDGYDLVSGWKKVRRDPPSKTLPSRLFNYTTATLTGIPLHDFNCGFKAYRREIFDHVELYGEFHRFVPVLANSLGFRIGEVVVQHHPRRFGRTKYGIRRFINGFVDLLAVLAITRFARRPGHLFGGAGTLLALMGTGVLGYLSILKLVTGAEIGGRPLLVFGALALVAGLQILFFGLLAELINSRTPGAAPAALIRETVRHSE